MGFAVATAGFSLAKGLLTTPSEKRAAKVLGGVLNAARSGNLLAVKVLDERRAIGIAKERAVWNGGWNQIAGNADLIKRYELAKDSLPRLDHSTPEAAAAQALGAKAASSATALNAALLPLKQAVDTADNAVREGTARALERVGLGLGAAGAREVRGEDGPLDRIIAIGKTSPSMFVGFVVLVVVLVIVLVRRR